MALSVGASSLESSHDWQIRKQACLKAFSRDSKTLSERFLAGFVVLISPIMGLLIAGSIIKDKAGKPLKDCLYKILDGGDLHYSDAIVPAAVKLRRRSSVSLHSGHFIVSCL